MKLNLEQCLEAYHSYYGDDADGGSRIPNQILKRPNGKKGIMASDLGEYIEGLGEEVEKLFRKHQNYFQFQKTAQQIERQLERIGLNMGDVYHISGRNSDIISLSQYVEERRDEYEFKDRFG